MCAGHLGLIDTPRQRKRTATDAVHAAGGTWCADNGCYSARWNEQQWWRWLTHANQLTHRATCAFAVAPDVVGDASATLERSMPWLPRIRALGYPAAFVAQDGITEPPWGDFDVLFIGGTDTFKLGPAGQRIIAAAVDRDVPVHMGRVNSERRYEYARALGCTSCDGTYLTFGADINLPHILAWSRNVSQPGLF